MKNDLIGAFGFPCRWDSEIGKHHENEFLYGLYYMYLTQKIDKVYQQKVRNTVMNYYRDARNLGFPNHIVDSVGEKEISHDQLTAYSCYSFIKGLSGHKVILKEIKMFKIRGRIVHPRDLIYYGLLNFRIWAFLTLPIYYLLCAASMFVPYRIVNGKVEEKLSGELLYVLRNKAVRRSAILSICMLPCRLIVKLGAKLRYGGISRMISKYFRDDVRNPIVRALR